MSRLRFCFNSVLYATAAVIVFCTFSHVAMDCVALTGSILCGGAMIPELKGSGYAKEHMVKWLGLLILLTVQNTTLRFLGLSLWRAEALIGVTFCSKQSVPYICHYMFAVFYHTASASYPGYYLDKHIVTLASVELHTCVNFFIFFFLSSQLFFLVFQAAFLWASLMAVN